MISNIGSLRNGIADKNMLFYENNVTPVGNFADLYIVENQDGSLRMDQAHKIYNKEYAKKHNTKILDVRKLGKEIRKIFDIQKIERPRMNDGSGKRTSEYFGISWNFTRIRSDFAVNLEKELENLENYGL